MTSAKVRGVKSTARFLGLALVLVLACGPAGKPAAHAVTPPSSKQSIDLALMDRAVKPGDDFYMFANGAWYAKAEIPADRTRAGVDVELTKEIEQRTKGILEEAVAAKGAPGSLTQKVADAYASYLDEAAIEALGIAPLASDLDAVKTIADKRALSAYLGAALRADVDPLNNTNLHTTNVFGLWVEQDLNDTTRYAPYLLQGGLGMPDRKYYVDAAPAMVETRAKYVAHLATLLKLAKVDGADAKAARAMALETKIANAHATRVESEDVSKANNPWPRAELGKRAPGMDWDAFFSAAHLEAQPSFIVWHPRATAGIAALVASEPLDAWKDYLTARVVEHDSHELPKAFVDEQFAFYSATLRGVKEQAPRARRALDEANAELGEAIGQLYVARYFKPESKAAVKAIVAALLQAFSRRIEALAWMAPATKAKAKEKLATLIVGIGYPDKWTDYGALSIVKGDPLGNAHRSERFEYARSVAKLGKPVDRAEWCIDPQVVDAINMPVRNALNFPAGILVAPFFDPNASDAANYGSIGAVIGHEISHSFDDEGAKFDARGRFANWWTPEDLTHFEASGKALAAQFSAYRPFPDLAVDGELTLSENIADLAGLAAAHDAWTASLEGKAAPIEQGLSGEQQFFLSYAQGWRTKVRDEALRMSLATNGHAPPHYRTFTVRNIDAWYTAFDVKPTDALYLAPANRVVVW